MFVKALGNALGDVSHTIVPTPDKNFYYRHIHRNCELMLFIKGDADFLINGEIFHLKPYDLILIPQGNYHYLNLCKSNPYENYVFYFDDTYIPQKKMDRLLHPPLVFNIRNDHTLIGLFKTLDTYADVYSEDDFQFCAQKLIQEILIYCCYVNRLPSIAAENNNEIIFDIIHHIDSHIEEELNVDILAKQLKLSRSHIQNIFSLKMQIGLKQYITQKKMYASYQDLLGGMAAVQVAEKYHYYNYSTFYRLFRKTFGVAPSEVTK